MTSPDRLGTRVNLTLPDEVIEALDVYAAAKGSRRSTVVRAWLEDAAPMMKAAAQAIETAKKNEAEGMKQIASILGQASKVSGQMELEIKAARRRKIRRDRGRST